MGNAFNGNNRLNRCLVVVIAFPLTPKYVYYTYTANLEGYVNLLVHIGRNLKQNEMNILKLSELPTTIKRAEEIIDYMLDNGYSTLINDLGSGIEYSVDDVLDSEEYLLKWAGFNQVSNNAI